MFESTFYHVLKRLFDDDNYDFLKLTFYLDKHYMSQKRISNNSLFVFLVPSKHNSIDFVIVVVDLYNEKFVVYDPELNCHQKNYVSDVQMLKTFLMDYREYFSFI